MHAGIYVHGKYGGVYGKYGGVSTVRGPTDPGLHHVGLPVELQEGRVLVQLGLPLGRRPLQLGHLAPQGGHLGTDVVNMMVVLGNTHQYVCHTGSRFVHRHKHLVSLLSKLRFVI